MTDSSASPLRVGDIAEMTDALRDRLSAAPDGRVEVDAQGEPTFSLADLQRFLAFQASARALGAEAVLTGLPDTHQGVFAQPGANPGATQDTIKAA
ncbi:MAG: hypothetical protein WBG08_08095 [Litorimonas sp.]